MPTAGEARLARNVTKRKSERSGIPVRLVERRGKENSEPNEQKLLQRKQKPKTKSAPDFSKLHRKWSNQFQKGKAVSKKPNTKINAFVLTECNGGNTCSTSEKISYHSSENDLPPNSDDDFEIDDNALQGILSNKGIQVQDMYPPQTRATIAVSHRSANSANVRSDFPGSFVKRTSIYYMGEKSTTASRHQPLSATGGMTRVAMATPLKGTKKRVAWADQDDSDDDEITFKPDSQALESILNERGIDDRQMRMQNLGRFTLASTRLSLFRNAARPSYLDTQPSKRTSIYYTGAKQRQAPVDLPRSSLAGSSRINMADKPLPPSQNIVSSRSQQHYIPGSTVIGVQHEESSSMQLQAPDPVTFTKPLMPPRHGTGAQGNNALSSTHSTVSVSNPLVTPCRGRQGITIQAVASNQPQACWSDVLTPHRGNANRVETSNPARNTAQLRPSSEMSPLVTALPSFSRPAWSRGSRVETIIPVPSPLRKNQPEIVQKLFLDDDTVEQQEVSSVQCELEELERQALEDLRLVEVEENQKRRARDEFHFSIQEEQHMEVNNPKEVSPVKPFQSPIVGHTPSQLGQPNSEISGDSVFSDQWLAATPQNHMRVTTRHRNTSVAKSHLTSDNGVLTPASCVTPNPLRTPLRNVLKEQNTGIPFGLMSSVKMSSSLLNSKRTHERISSASPQIGDSSFASSLSWADVFCSSTPCVEGAAPENSRLVSEARQGNGPFVPTSKGLSVRNNTKVVDGNEARNMKRANVKVQSGSVAPQGLIRKDIIQCNDLSLRSAVRQHRGPGHVNQRNYDNVNSISALPESMQLRAFKPLVRIGVDSAINVRTANVSLPSSVQVTTTLVENALLDAEVTLYTSVASRMRTSTCMPRRQVTNPLVKLFNDCDPQHFIPLCECREKNACFTHPLPCML